MMYFNNLLKIMLFGFLSICIMSCGDMFKEKRKILGNYYLLENDTRGGLSLYLKANSEDFVGRIRGRILEYGFVDSFLVVKCKPDGTMHDKVIYIINMNRDSHYAEEKDYLVGPLTEDEYYKNWKYNKKIKFTRVE